MPYLRYALDLDLLNELRNLVPEANVVPTARRLRLEFKGTKGLHAFLDDLADDEDLIREAAGWFYGLRPESVEGTLRLRPALDLPPERMTAVAECLRRLRQEEPAASERVSRGRKHSREDTSKQ